MGDPKKSSSSSSSSSSSGCANVFLQLFDWNRRRGLFSKKLLPAERSLSQSQKKQKANEGRLPMAKLLLIADEKRRYISNKQAQQVETASRTHVGAVARLMGLESLPHEEESRRTKLDSASPSKSPTLASTATAAEAKSLQELLHSDQEPKMLQEYLSVQQHIEEEEQPSTTGPQDPLLSLLIQEVIQTKTATQQRKQRIRKRSNSSSFLFRNSSQPSSQCCAMMPSSKSTKSAPLFLEAASKVLEQQDEFHLLAPHRRNPRRLSMSAVSSPVANDRSLMELFLDIDFEFGAGSSMLERHAMSEPSSPARRHFRSHHQQRPPTSPVDMGNCRTPSPIPDEDDYVSFRYFLTSSSPKSKESGMKSPSDSKDAAVKQQFGLRNNPLFEESSSDNSSEMFSSEGDDRMLQAPDCDDDDQGLEEILKSILVNTSTVTNREHHNYLYEEDTNSRSMMMDQADDNHSEVTSESNCGEDCGQPSPVSVLESPFDEHHSRGSKRSANSTQRRLNFNLFDDNQDGSATTCQSSLPPCFTYDQAEKYLEMVLKELGVDDDEEIIPESIVGIISDAVFERLEDRMRVQQLIEHLEDCTSSSSSFSSSLSSSNNNNLQSLRIHYQSYHEHKSRRRMLFDYVNEMVAEITRPYGDEAWIRCPALLPYISSKTLASKVLEMWRQMTFERCNAAAENDVLKSIKEEKDRENDVAEIGLYLERSIFKDLIEELASELLEV